LKNYFSPLITKSNKKSAEPARAGVNAVFAVWCHEYLRDALITGFFNTHNPSHKFESIFWGWCFGAGMSAAEF
jgi:hypothetical protein